MPLGSVERITRQGRVLLAGVPSDLAIVTSFTGRFVIAALTLLPDNP
jgi:hypothetical protein